MTTADKVIAYLKANPSFLTENEKILALLDIDVATPFHERQLGALKQREKRQKQKLQLILESAEHNQKLEAGLLAVATRLLAAKKQTDPIGFVTRIIKNQFAIDKALLLLSPKEQANTPGKYDELEQRVKHKSSVCDDRVSSQLLNFLFDKEFEEIASCAFIPLLHEDSLIGVGVLGATDKQRFSPQNGVIYLDRLGVLIGSYLMGVNN